VLRLWPETTILGLFPGGCTLRRGTTIRSRECTKDADGAHLLTVIRSMLEEMKPFRRAGRTEVYVSDSLARIALLPWQSKLNSPEQVSAYGQACLEQYGVMSSGEWATHAGFRQYGAMGMAVALPAAFVRQLAEVIAEAGLRLCCVMPVSTAAYWYFASDRGANTSLVWLQEEGRLTALTYGRGKLLSLDVEPVLKQGGAAQLRLVNRIKLSNTSPSQISYWSVPGTAIDAAFLNGQFESAVITNVEGRRWT